MWEKRLWIGSLLVMLVLVMAACGEPSEDKVKKKVEGALSEMGAYKVGAKMNILAGETDRTYEMDIWYNKKDTDFYRVTLHDETDEESKQVILKNEEGVFVLTPKMNKSFKFQADWPKNNRQPYLLQTVMQDVLDDRNATMKAADDFYVFQTVTNYQNNPNLPYQNVYIDKKTYIPKVVQLLDEEKTMQMEVTFHSEQFEAQFAAEDFNREAILDEAFANRFVDGEEVRAGFVATYPYELLGAKLDEEKYITLDNGVRAILTFKGEKDFTLIQEQVEARTVDGFVEEEQGEAVHLGHSIGVLTGGGLSWDLDNVHYYLASSELTREELIDVATSIVTEEIK